MTLPIASTTFPNVAQQAFTSVPEAPLIGDVWEGEIYNPGSVSYFLPSVVQEAQVTTITLGANAPGDTLTVTIDGAKITATAGADLAASTAAVEAAIEAAAIFAAIVGVTVASPVATLTFLDYEDHVVSVASSGATTIAAATSNAAVSNAELDYGMWAAKRAPVGSFLNVMGQPSATSDLFAGVLFRVPGSAPFTNIQVETLGFDSDWLPPNRAYLLALAGMGIVVQYSGTAPTVLDSVYRVCSGTDYGKWAASDLSTAGTSKVVTLTLTTTAADALAFNFDGLPDLTIASASGTEATDAAAFYALWLANATYNALGTIVNNGAGVLQITFNDTTTHVFTDNSGGASTVVEAVITAAVASTAATAVLVPGASWGRPSISSVSGQPNRAFLRLSPA
jgi:hypothetical protein